MNSFLIRMGTFRDLDSPILRLDPAGQDLPDVHGEVVIVQIVHMFEESDLQLLDLLPLAHARSNTSVEHSS